MADFLSCERAGISINMYISDVADVYIKLSTGFVTLATIESTELDK